MGLVANQVEADRWNRVGQAQNAAGLAMQEKKNEGLRGAGVEAAGEQAKGAQAQAEAERFRQENAEADQQRNAMETAIFTAKVALNKLPGKPIRKSYSNDPDFNRDLAAWEANKKELEDGLAELEVQRRAALGKGGQKAAGQPAAAVGTRTVNGKPVYGG